MISNKVKQSASFIMQKATHVKICETKLKEMGKWLVENKNYDLFGESSNHPSKEDKLSIEEYLLFTFLTDAMNFCFWPFGKEYEDLTAFIKEGITSKKLTVNSLSEMTLDEFKEIITVLIDKDPYDQIPERHRILKDHCTILRNEFNGSMKELMKQAEFKAESLLKLIIEKFTSFQDHCVYKGRQVFFYKRAQILIGDFAETLKTIHSYREALSEEDRKYCDDYHFENGIEEIANLTCFADYRVPQTLHKFGVISYTKELEEKINNKILIPSGSEEESEIRAAMIHSIELLKEAIQAEWKIEMMSVEIDWILWQYGEKYLKDTYPFHRVLGIFY